MCVYVCVSQHFFRPRLSTALNVHSTKTSPDGSCARTNGSQLFSSWFRYRLLKVRRGRCCKVCFHGHQNWVPITIKCFQVFKTSYHRARNIGIELVRPNDVPAKRVELVPTHDNPPPDELVFCYFILFIYFSSQNHQIYPLKDL